MLLKVLYNGMVTLLGQDTKRDKRMDGLKFILIFLVVLGHITHPYYDVLWITKYIYTFHMPVFVFISGFFSSSDVEWVKLRKWIIKTLVIYIISQLLLNIIYIIVGVPVSLSLWLFLTPQFGLWYLVSLLYWRIGIKCLANRYDSSFLFGLSLLMAFVAGFVPIDKLFSFQRTFTLLPFFMLGYCFKQKQLLRYLEKSPSWIYYIIIVIGLYASRNLPIYMPNTHYGSIKIFGAHTIIGLFMCISVVRLSRNKVVELLSSGGRYTLWIYIGHLFLIVIQNAIIKNYNITIDVPEAIILSLLYVALIISIAEFYKGLKSMNILFAGRRKGR